MSRGIGPMDEHGMQQPESSLWLDVFSEPEEEELSAICGLAESCNKADHTCYGAPDDADLYLCLYRGEQLLSVLAAYSMGETFQGRNITEISAFTDPEERKKGYFKKLLGTLREQPEGDAVFRFAVYETAVTDAVLRKLGAVRDHAELIMKAELTQKPEPMEALNCMTVEEEDEDGEKVYYCRGTFSECRVRLFQDRAYIFGVLTYAGHRREHRAEKLMHEVFSWLWNKGCAGAFLEVSDENTAAYQLYRKLGFRESERITYYLV